MEMRLYDEVLRHPSITALSPATFAVLMRIGTFICSNEDEKRPEGLLRDYEIGLVRVSSADMTSALVELQQANLLRRDEDRRGYRILNWNKPVSKIYHGDLRAGHVNWGQPTLKQVLESRRFAAARQARYRDKQKVSLRTASNQASPNQSVPYPHQSANPPF